MAKKKTILFFGLHRPNRSPSQRYRIEQFLPHLDKNDISYDYGFLLNEKRDKKFYAPGNYFGKLYIVLYSILKLIKTTFFQAKNYEYIFVQREVFMLGTAFFEKQMAKRSKLIFDFDDSIWLQNVSKANRKLAFLKNAEKTSEIIKVSHQVVVGNQYLAEYALQFNQNVTIIPTCIDTDEYKSTKDKPAKDKICIGWSGSATTVAHFNLAVLMLLKLKEKYGEKIYFKVLGDGNYTNEELNIQGVAWNRKTEIQELEEMDIGIMPLPNDEWTKGKCGLKGLVYMSMGFPSVMQNVGVNPEIVQDGENGFLAQTEEEWINKLSLLIENRDLRKKLSLEASKTLFAYYSVFSLKEKFINLFFTNFNQRG